MKQTALRATLLALFWVGCQPGVVAQQKASDVALDKLLPHNVKTQPEEYRGRASIRVTDDGPASLGDAGRFAVVPSGSLQDGTIDVDLAGDTLPNAIPTARGFVGMIFRMSADQSHFECFYLRPKNGRAEDQLQRNHSVQYVSMPGYSWDKLRNETPGKYESYVDLVPGEWTHVKIEVSGTHAQLYVNHGEQPVLIVNDLKQPPIKGSIALWVGPGTIAHFANLKVSP